MRERFSFIINICFDTDNCCGIHNSGLLYLTETLVKFRQLMSKQQESQHTRGNLLSAFRIFDDDDDGCIHAGDLVDVLTSFGEKLSKSEARKLVQSAAKKEDGLIDYKGECRPYLN